MLGVVTRPGTREKLGILSADAQYDLACACGSAKEEHRKSGADGRWIYPVTLPNGGRSMLFKTLISNVCNNDCKYCPLREGQDLRRCTLGAEETAGVFMDYLRAGEVFGLFLSSGVVGSADATMERLVATAKILRKKEAFRGYIHLKVIPGASEAAIEEAVSVASSVSLNIEVPGAEYLAKLSDNKRYIEDIIGPMKYISRLTGKGGKYEGKKQTTQFIVGAAGEKDAEIVKYTAGLYERVGLSRVYFSAYQRGLGEASLPAERAGSEEFGAGLKREHRLYQVDFLLRKYGFGGEDIIFDEGGNLSLSLDPKEVWAKKHPEIFPVAVNLASREELLRVPGLGPTTVKRILEVRREGRIGSLGELGRVGKRLVKAAEYVVF